MHFWVNVIVLHCFIRLSLEYAFIWITYFCTNNFVTIFVTKNMICLKRTMYLEHLIFWAWSLKVNSFFFFMLFGILMESIYNNNNHTKYKHIHRMDCIVHIIWFWMLSEWRLVITWARERARTNAHTFQKELIDGNVHKSNSSTQ